MLFANPRLSPTHLTWEVLDNINQSAGMQLIREERKGILGAGWFYPDLIAKSVLLSSDSV
jgi:hypothetical protein